MTDQKNTLLAIVLSAIVLIVWQYFFGLPHMQRQEAQKQPQTQTQGVPTPAPGGGPSTTVPVPGQPATVPAAQVLTRDAALKQTARVPIDTPRLKGSIALKGGRIDDISLAQYHETVDPNSPPIVLLSPSESPHPFYAEFGWVAAAGAAGRGYGVAPGRIGRAHARPPDRAHLQQQRGAHLPPHDLGRRQIPFQ